MRGDECYQKDRSGRWRRKKHSQRWYEYARSEARVGARSTDELYAQAFAIYTRRMNNLSLGLSVLLSAGFLMLGCGSSSDADPCTGGQVDCGGSCIDPIAATLPAIQASIFEPRGCASGSCHDDTLPAADLDLSSVTASGMNLVNVPSLQVTESLLVAPNDSGASYLMNKIEGIGIPLGFSRMPLNNDGVVLCDAEINSIRQWIDDGALVP
jgi:hypothetical protein